MNPFYFDNTGARRKNVIYASIIDRFLLVDDVDINITFETANILSSKIATVVYATPNNTNGMNNLNCMEYMIFDKSGSNKSGSPILVKGQTPITRIIENPLQFTFVGPVKDIDEPETEKMISKLKEYTDFVHEQMTFIHIFKLFGAEFDTKTFSDEFFDPEIINGKTSRYDNSMYDEGILNELKRVMYVSNSIEEAKNNIEGIWNNSDSKRMLEIRDKIREVLVR
jgi:hypothetical protein